MGTKKKVSSGRGGYRPGAGRPKGSKNKKTLEAEAVQQVITTGKVTDKKSESAVEKLVNNILPSDKIVDIINVCKSSNIKSLEYGNLKLEFISNPSESPQTTIPLVHDPEPPKRMFAEVDEEEFEDLRLSQLMIDDPAAFEQEIIDSHTGKDNAEA